MKFNEKLIKLRKMSGLSQEELGNKLNVARQTVSKWELGYTDPEMKKLIELSNLFNISIDELVKEKELDIEEEFNVSQHNTGSTNQIFIESPLVQNLVSCFKVTVSPVLISSKNQPKYLLLGVDKVTILGEHKTLLGWYETKESIQKEISEIASAIREGKNCYTLKYNVDVNEKTLGVIMKKVQEKDKHIKFPKILICVLSLATIIIIFYFGGSIIETIFDIGRKLGNAIGDLLWK